MLNDPVIDAEQQPDVQNRGGECQPAEKLVTAHRESTGSAGPRPNRQHAEDEATGDRAETQGLRDLPRCSERRHGLVRVYTADAGALLVLVLSDGSMTAFGQSVVPLRLHRASRQIRRVPLAPHRSVVDL